MGRWKKAQRRPPRAGGQPEERRVIRHARLQRPQPEAPLAGDVAQARQQFRQRRAGVGVAVKRQIAAGEDDLAEALGEPLGGGAQQRPHQHGGRRPAHPRHDAIGAETVAPVLRDERGAGAARHARRARSASRTAAAVTAQEWRHSTSASAGSATRAPRRAKAVRHASASAWLRRQP